MSCTELEDTFKLQEEEDDMEEERGDGVKK